MTTITKIYIFLHYSHYRSKIDRMWDSQFFPSPPSPGAYTFLSWATFSPFILDKTLWFYTVTQLPALSGFSVESGMEWRQIALCAKKHQHFPLGLFYHLAVWTVKQQIKIRFLIAWTTQCHILFPKLSWSLRFVEKVLEVLERVAQRTVKRSSL